MKPVTRLLLFLMTPALLLAQENAYRYVDGFNAKTGQLYGWKGRTDSAMNYYGIESEEGNGFLRVRNNNTDNFIIKQVKVDIVKYPYLNWRWRPQVFPPNGDESKKPTCDNVASMNVILRASRWRPKTIKYSWSTTLPKGTFTESPYAIWPARADIVVMRSGMALKGQWVSEKRNVLADYKRLYEEEDVESYIIEAIVIMSDGDNTGTKVAADYDDIYFSAK